MNRLGLVLQVAEAGGLQGQSPLGLQSKFKVSLSNFVSMFQNKSEKRAGIWGDSSLGKVLNLQACGPEFKSSVLHSTLGVEAQAYGSTAGEADAGKPVQ